MGVDRTELAGLPVGGAVLSGALALCLLILAVAALPAGADQGVVTYAYPASPGRDPFVPLLVPTGEGRAKEPSASELFDEYLGRISVNGVLWSEDNPLVMINNDIYHTDDVVENLRISEITPESVTLRFRDLSETIQLIDLSTIE